MFDGRENLGIEEFLRRCPGWEVEYRPRPVDPRGRCRGIDERNHYPEWENIRKSVIIRITQFDIGGDITARNLELAEYLRSVCEPYAKAGTA